MNSLDRLLDLKSIRSESWIRSSGEEGMMHDALCVWHEERVREGTVFSRGHFEF